MTVLWRTLRSVLPSRIPASGNARYSARMTTRRLELRGLERVRYMAPTLFCVYLVCLCMALLVVAQFLARRQDSVATTAAAIFGLVLSGALGLAFWHTQQQNLRYAVVRTERSATLNFDRLREAMLAAGWQFIREEPSVSLEARTAGTVLTVGERVAVRCEGQDVLVASICDPEVGFSLAGRRRCAEHRREITAAVQTPSIPPEG